MNAVVIGGAAIWGAIFGVVVTLAVQEAMRCV